MKKIVNYFLGDEYTKSDCIFFFGSMILCAAITLMVAVAI